MSARLVVLSWTPRNRPAIRNLKRQSAPCRILDGRDRARSATVLITALNTPLPGDRTRFHPPVRVLDGSLIGCHERYTIRLG